MVPVTSKEIARTLDKVDICKRLTAILIFAAISMKAMYRVLTPQRIIGESDFHKIRDCDEELKQNFLLDPVQRDQHNTELDLSHRVKPYNMPEQYTIVHSRHDVLYFVVLIAPAVEGDQGSGIRDRIRKSISNDPYGTKPVGTH